jgi:hypothetical protein
LLSTARAAVAPADLDAFRREVEASLGSMVEQMPPDALARARDRALDQLVRERFHLPTILFA